MRLSSNYLFTIFLILGIHSDISGQAAFRDVTKDVGINHSFKVFEGTFGGGAAVLDYNQDGFEDVLMTGGAGENQLYHNNGDGTFNDVSEVVGLGVLSNIVTQGVVTADVNKDGYTDLFFTTIANVKDGGFKKTSNVLLLGNANSTFTDGSQAFGIAELPTFSTGATFGDFNKDGYPDLYVGNYFQNYTGSLDQFSGPQIDDTGGPAADLLYINQGGEKFVEISKSLGVNHTGFSFGGVWSDYDNDGDLDLFIVNDFGFRATTDLLYRNEYPQLKFTDVSHEKGFDFGINAMGIAVGDCNLDGQLDYMVSNLQASPLFINQGAADRFWESSRALQTWYPFIETDRGYSVTPVSWGVNFFDADNDMDLDLYLTNGALNPGLPPNPNLFFYNDNGIFIESSKTARVNDPSIGRGSIYFDYDNDGDLDLLVVNQTPYQDNATPFINQGTRLYENQASKSKNNWLKVQLAGVFSETRGIGSKVKAYVGDKVLIREIDGGSSHESQNSTIAHFGLGVHPQIDSLVIDWSGGQHQIVQDVGINQMINVQEEISGDFQANNTASLAINPNPTTDAAIIEFDLEENTNWSLDLYNILGVKIRHLDSGKSTVGLYFLNNLNDLSQGIYIITVSNSKFAVSEKLLVR